MRVGFVPWEKIAAIGSVVNSGIAYLLRDVFATTLAAGAVNGTAAEPGPGTRNVTDVGSRITVTAGELFLNGGSGAWNQTGGWYTPAIIRAAGLVLAFDLRGANFNTALAGFTAAGDANFTGYNNVGIELFSTPTIAARRTSDATSPLLYNLVNATQYRVYVVLRSTGRYIFLRVAGVTKLLHWDDWDNTASLYVGATHFAAIAVSYLGNITVPSGRYYRVTALASDSFNRTDGAVGATDGAGHAEANSGGGLTWTDRVGSFAVSSDAAVGTLDGGLAVSTVNAGTADVVLEVKATVAGGVAGGVARWTDANNHLRFYHDGTNAVLDQVLAGSVTTLKTQAMAYAAGAPIRLALDGQVPTLWYNEIRTTTTPTSANAALTATAHGLYTTHAGNSLENFLAFPRNGYADLGAI
jgi:hypothetical protein